MFTGIIEEVGRVVSVKAQDTNITFGIDCSFTAELKVDQSIAHNGVCLTVTKIENNLYYVTAIKETLERTNLKELVANSPINLERCMLASMRIDGHIVQGHVDTVGTCSEIIQNNNESWEFFFEHEISNTHITVKKGSIAINGVSLTVVNSTSTSFSVAIIPFTHEHTTFRQLKTGDLVNLEFDILGKYIQKLINKE